ncbi:PREDICTED: acid ceramidase-like, partial [Amphimedon queenslandica]|uniref:Acid ceramidase N-terminal domain-containing protein n=1 Tax=Amphimedon queenslandica TaxID=400682 RepID=A0A1X7SVR9_AMPQE
MSSSLVIFFSFLALTAVAKDVELPRFTIDLDQPPEERWTEIATQYTKELKETVEFFAKTYDELYAMLSILGGDVDKYIPDPYAGEIKGIASTTGVTAGEILFINIIYGLTAFGDKSSSSKSLLGCTSIVSQTESGNILHGRNLDYGISLLRNIAIIVDFQVSEVTTFTATTFAGYVGVLTGQK